MPLNPRVTEVPLFHGDDLDQMSVLHQQAELATRKAKNLRRELEAEMRSGDARMGDDDAEVLAAEAEAQEARSAHNTFLDEATKRAEIIELRSIGRRRYRKLRAEHPPRYVIRTIDDARQEIMHEDDREYGVNSETFSLALLNYLDPKDPDFRTIVKPQFGSTNEREEFIDDLADGEVERLWTAAYYLNSLQGADPKASRYSEELPSSDATSE